MESRNDSLGEDVTENVAEPSGAEGVDAGDDSAADALPDFIKKIFGKNKEKETQIAVGQRKDDLYYNTDHPRRGLAVIFNHEYFDAVLKQNRRIGTAADCSSLTKTFSSMDFEVRVLNDLTVKQVAAVLDDLASTNFADCDCLLIAVLSHGQPNVIYAKNGTYPVETLFDRFVPDRCRTLAGKPKIFVVQACRGDRMDAGVNVRIEMDGSMADCKAAALSYSMPSYADFLFAYSTIPGYVSWRDTCKGSWFIRAFCEEFDKHWRQYDFTQILTFVNRRVAYDFESRVPGDRLMCHKKQTSCYVSQLTRFLKFNPK